MRREQDGVVKNCTEYQQVYDGWTCETVEDAYDVTFAQFYAYNPVIGKDCSSLWPSKYLEKENSGLLWY